MCWRVQRRASRRTSQRRENVEYGPLWQRLSGYVAKHGAAQTTPADLLALFQRDELRKILKAKPPPLHHRPPLPLRCMMAWTVSW